MNMNNFFSKPLSSPTKLPAKIVGGVCLLVAVAVIAIIWGNGLKIQTNIKLKSIEKIGDLCLLKVFDTYIITNEVNGVSGTFIAPCDAILKLDFSKIEISGSNGVYTVSFPPITVSQPRVDREDDSFQTFEVSKGLSSLLKSSDLLRKSAMEEAERRIEKEALSARFIDAAKEQATNIVSALIRQGTGIDEIAFQWYWHDGRQEDDATSPTDTTDSEKSGNPRVE